MLYIPIGLSTNTRNNTISSGESTDSVTNECHYPLYVAKFDFLAESSDMLSFKKGDFLYTLNDKKDWWHAKARHLGEKGCVPSNYLRRYVSLEAYR